MASDGNCRNCDYGPALYNVPQALKVSTVWDLPLGHGGKWLGNANKGLDTLVGGWGLDFIASFQEGTPITVTTPNTTIWSQRENHANRFCNGRNELSNQDIRTNGLFWLATSCFAQPAAGYLGNSGSAILTGPGMNDWDIGVHKDFRIREAMRLQFRGEFFNAFNHTQFANPDIGVTDVNFGKVIATQVDPREIQLSLKLTF
jgi:hypothetical protein